MSSTSANPLAWRKQTSVKLPYGRLQISVSVSGTEIDNNTAEWLHGILRSIRSQSEKQIQRTLGDWAPVTAAGKRRVRSTSAQHLPGGAIVRITKILITSAVFPNDKGALVSQAVQVDDQYPPLLAGKFLTTQRIVQLAA
jgi:hypothetical protein